MAEYQIGEKVVFIDPDSYPQVWEVCLLLGSGWYHLVSDGTYLDAEMPANVEEIRAATECEILANKRM